MASLLPGVIEGAGLRPRPLFSSADPYRLSPVELPGEVPVLTEFSMVLLECRRRGSDFDSAWRAAMKVVRIERGNMDEQTREEMQDWRKALVWAREHFEASYARTHAQVAQPSLADALSERVSAGERSRVSV